MQCKHCDNTALEQFDSCFRCGPSWNKTPFPVIDAAIIRTVVFLGPIEREAFYLDLAAIADSHGDAVAANMYLDHAENRSNWRELNKES